MEDDDDDDEMIPDGERETSAAAKGHGTSSAGSDEEISSLENSRAASETAENAPCEESIKENMTTKLPTTSSAAKVTPKFLSPTLSIFSIDTTAATQTNNQAQSPSSFVNQDHSVSSSSSVYSYDTKSQPTSVPILDPTQDNASRMSTKTMTAAGGGVGGGSVGGVGITKTVGGIGILRTMPLVPLPGNNGRLYQKPVSVPMRTVYPFRREKSCGGGTIFGGGGGDDNMTVITSTSLSTKLHHPRRQAYQQSPTSPSSPTSPAKDTENGSLSLKKKKMIPQKNTFFERGRPKGDSVSSASSTTPSSKTSRHCHKQGHAEEEGPFEAAAAAGGGRGPDDQHNQPQRQPKTFLSDPIPSPSSPPLFSPSIQPLFAATEQEENEVVSLENAAADDDNDDELVNTKIRLIFNERKIADLQRFLKRREYLNYCNIPLVYLFHLFQTSGIFLTALSTQFSWPHLIYLGISFNFLATLINTYEQINNSISEKTLADIINIRDGTYVDEGIIVEEQKM
jgi:hypothetical protein